MEYLTEEVKAKKRKKKKVKKIIKPTIKPIIKPIVKKIIKPKGIKKWFMVYNGPHKHMKFPGIGRIIPGKEYPISEQRAYQFRAVDPKKGFKVIGRYVYDK